MIPNLKAQKLSDWRAERRIQRRSVLQVMTTAPVWVSMLGQAAIAQTSANDISILVDTFVPRDQSPSASDLDIHLRLLELASGIPNYPELLSQGMGWVNNIATRLHKNPFSELSPKQRDETLKLAVSQPSGTLPQVFVSRARNDTMALYYADHRAWAGLGLDGPIQPGGYPTQDQPPEQ